MSLKQTGSLGREGRLITTGAPRIKISSSDVDFNGFAVAI